MTEDISNTPSTSEPDDALLSNLKVEYIEKIGIVITDP
jgi:hypothetical protein